MAAETNSAPEGAEEERTAPLPLKLRINPANLCLGLSLGAVALWAVKVDAVNNYTFGLTMGHEAAQVALVGALALLLLPIARLTEVGKPYDKLLAAVQWACVLVTACCAFFAYLNTAGQDIADRAKADAEYRTAATNAQGWRDEASRQRARAEGIAEDRALSVLTPAVERAAISYQAALAYAQDQKLPCQRSRTCREALATLSPLEDAKAKAEGKQEALKLAREADELANKHDAIAKGGKPSEPQIYATLAASWSGGRWEAGTVERVARLFMACLNIAVTVLLSTIVGYAGAALKASFRWEDPNSPTPAPAKPEPTKRERKAVTAKVVEAIKDRAIRGLPAFLQDCRPGPAVSYAELQACLKEWWRLTHQIPAVPSRQLQAKALDEAGFRKLTDRNGKVSYLIELPDLSAYRGIPQPLYVVPKLSLAGVR